MYYLRISELYILIKSRINNYKTMKTIDYSHYIERYNNGEMSDAEKNWFHKELDSNEPLLKEVKFRKHTDEVLKNNDILSLRSKLAQIESERVPTKQHINSGNKRYMKYVAVISALILIGSLTFFPGIKQSNDEIISKYYKEYKPQTNLRSSNPGTNNDYVLAVDFYNTHDYKNAALLFRKVLESKPRDMQSEFLYGVAKYEDKEYPDAKQSFDKVIKDNNNLYIETAKWYLALCFIKTNDIDNAIQLLEIIKDEGGIFKNESKKIIRKLNRN